MSQIPGRTGSTTSSTTDVAKDQAAQMGQDAKESTQHVAGVTKEQATNVASEAGRQARDLLHQGRDEINSQLASQQQRAADSLASLGNELRALAEGQGGSGIATDLAHQASDRVSSIATWLGERDPGSLLDEVQTFARRRPGASLAVAAGVGVLAGRLTRGMATNAKEQHSSARQQIDLDAPTAGTTYTARATYPTETSYAAGSGQQIETVYPAGTAAYGTDPLPATDDLPGTPVAGGFRDTRGQVAP